MLKTLFVTATLSIVACFSSFAAEGWVQEGNSWKYQLADGSLVKNEWEWIDGNQNGIAECYYFNSNGIMANNQKVNGYIVDSEGKWTVNGSVQEKLISELNGWQELNGYTVYVHNGTILKNCITPDDIYVGENGERVESAIDPVMMQEKSQGCRYIAISKSTHALEFWENGNLKHRFTVNTGLHYGDKEVEGDRKTPLGEFYVCKKIPNSNYHLALGVSYPAIEDAERGIQNGLISQAQYRQIVTANQMGQTPDWHTALGGYIEIHGKRTPYGTNGCISMRNEDVELLYSLTSTGDKILIMN